MATKVKKNKMKTHKAASKRFRITKGGKGDKIIHLGQGAGNGHSNSYKNRRQKASPKGPRAMGSIKEAKKIRQLIRK